MNDEMENQAEPVIDDITPPPPADMPDPAAEPQTVLSGGGAEETIAEGAAPQNRLFKACERRHAILAELMARGAAALTDKEFVHDLRVAARRMEEAVRLLERFLEKPAAKVVKASLKSLRRAMGDLRDSDVTREHLAKWKMPRGVKKVAQEMAEVLQAKRESLTLAAAELMSSARVQGAMTVVASVLEERGKTEEAAATEAGLRAAVVNRLKSRKKRLRESFGKAAMKQTAVSLHAARIAVKKLRYVLELAEEAKLEQGLKKEVKFLKGVQEILGDHHDVHVLEEMLEAHLHDHRRAPIRSLAAQWRSWKRTMERGQAQRAGEFFMASYTWMNA